MTPRPRKQEYLTPSEAAAYLTSRGYPISGRTVSRMCDRGDLPHIRTSGGFKRIRATALEQFADTALDTLDSDN